jgi:hypothetical protein
LKISLSEGKISFNSFSNTFFTSAHTFIDCFVFSDSVKKPYQAFFCINFTFSQASFNNSSLSLGVIISAFDIVRPEIVEYLYQKFLISSTNFAVTSGHNSSKLLARIFCKVFFFKVSFINQSPSGTISLKSNLQ